MNALSLPIRSAVLVIVVGVLASSVHATGLYIDLPAYFSAIDTSHIELVIRQAELQRVTGRASVFSGELSLRPRSRLHVRFGLLYPAMVRGWDITHAVGDGIVNGTYRLTGDTLEVNGMFLRIYARLPFGPKRMDPFSFGSLDAGAGFEFRMETSLFRLRCAETYTLVGERRKPTTGAPNDTLYYPLSVAERSSDTECFSHRNFFLFALSIDFTIRRSTTFSFAGYSFRYRGGDAREVYMLTFGQRLCRGLELHLCGGLDAGNDFERVFDSLLSVSLVYRLLPRGEDENGK